MAGVCNGVSLWPCVHILGSRRSLGTRCCDWCEQKRLLSVAGIKPQATRVAFGCYMPVSSVVTAGCAEVQPIYGLMRTHRAQREPPCFKARRLQRRNGWLAAAVCPVAQTSWLAREGLSLWH